MIIRFLNIKKEVKQGKRDSPSTPCHHIGEASLKKTIVRVYPFQNSALLGLHQYNFTTLDVGDIVAFLLVFKIEIKLVMTLEYDINKTIFPKFIPIRNSIS